YGNVGINLNPDPSGGHWTSPPLSDRSWYPIYEKMVEYDIPAMVHVSTTCIPELVKCVEQYGNVGINLNPDPSGGHWTSPPLSDRSWYPIYE
ncbi:amidohydrolase family protein, partial [Escherichia coli]|uniref:amidohydrolase family protein n=1 Tax=Escherichia coli TaxID=562 RepID=UPI001BC883E3